MLSLLMGFCAGFLGAARIAFRVHLRLIVGFTLVCWSIALVIISNSFRLPWLMFVAVLVLILDFILCFWFLDASDTN
jgi:hypothetical protein